MQTRRVDMLVAFGAACMMVLAFAFAMIRMPHVLFASLLVVFLITAVMLGIRVFAYSDDWFRAQEFKTAAWYARHPRLTICMGIAVGFGVLIQLVQLVRTLLD